MIFSLRPSVFNSHYSPVDHYFITACTTMKMYVLDLYVQMIRIIKSKLISFLVSKPASKMKVVVQLFIQHRQHIGLMLCRMTVSEFLLNNSVKCYRSHMTNWQTVIYYLNIHYFKAGIYKNNLILSYTESIFTICP